jgi:hypothetical protein
MAYIKMAEAKWGHLFRGVVADEVLAQCREIRLTTKIPRGAGWLDREVRDGKRGRVPKQTLRYPVEGSKVQPEGVVV